MQVILLVVLTVVAGVAVILPAEFLIGPGQFRPASVALALCLVPAAVTLRMAVQVKQRAPSLFAPIVLMGIGFRLLTVVGGVLVLARAVVGPGGSSSRFAEWVAVFYVITLAIESGILIRGVASSGPTVRAGCEDEPTPDARR